MKGSFIIFIAIILSSCGGPKAECVECRNISLSNKDSVVSEAISCNEDYSNNEMERDARAKLPNDSNTRTECIFIIGGK